MSTGLPVQRYISTNVNLAPSAAQANNVNTAMIIGDSNVVDVGQRYRAYSSLSGVATDFGTSAPEYLAAALFFGQTPQPASLSIGRWARQATAGILKSAVLTSAQQALANFTAVTSGGFKIQVDAGSLTAVTGVNLSAAGNLNAVATAITSALTAATIGATCTWNANTGQFVFTSNTTGTASKVAPLQAPASGTDLAAILFAKAAQGAVEVDGIAAETALAAVQAVEAAAPYFYGLTFACTSGYPVDADIVSVAGYVQGSASNHIFGATTQDTSHLAAGSTTNLGYLLQNAAYTRTFLQYSSQSPYAAASLLGRLITVDYTANNSAITLAFKQEPGVGAENLTTNQANALDGYRVNYFTQVNNGTSIVANGWCSGPAYIDEIASLDAFATVVQTNLYNVLFTMPKVPQTDAGVNLLVGAANQAGAQFVRNGTFAPGLWTGPTIGALNTGDTVAAGYYTYAIPVAQQSAGDRAARKSPTIQIAVKMAGAVQSVAAIVNVNR